MKRIVLLLLFIFLFLNKGFAAEPELVTVRIDDRDRTFYRYVPQSNNAENPSAVFICLHGLGRNGEDFFSLMDLSALADEYNSIILAPNAIREEDEELIEKLQGYAPQFPIEAVWGCKMNMKITVFDIPFGDDIIPQWDIFNEEFNKSVNDNKFISTLISDVKMNYPVKNKEVFLIGMSMGSYMAYNYILSVNFTKIAGVITIAGSMSENMSTGVSAKVALCDFHSEDDQVIPYAGSYELTVPYNDDFLKARVTMGMDKTEVINSWVGKNGASSDVEETVFEDSGTGKSAIKYVYPSTSGKEVIHYKISGIGHAESMSKGAGDSMDYGEEIAEFLKAHMTPPVSTGINHLKGSSIKVFPNPAEDYIYISAEDVSNFMVIGMDGRKYLEGKGQTRINIQSLPSGIYFLRIVTNTRVCVERFVKK